MTSPNPDPVDALALAERLDGLAALGFAPCGEAAATLRANAVRIAVLERAHSQIVAECAMSREQFVMRGPAFACRQVERAVGIARQALSDAAQGVEPTSEPKRLYYNWRDSRGVVRSAMVEPGKEREAIDAAEAAYLDKGTPDDR